MERRRVHAPRHGRGSRLDLPRPHLPRHKIVHHAADLHHGLRPGCRRSARCLLHVAADQGEGRREVRREPATRIRHVCRVARLPDATVATAAAPGRARVQDRLTPTRSRQRPLRGADARSVEEVGERGRRAGERIRCEVHPLDLARWAPRDLEQLAALAPGNGTEATAVLLGEARVSDGQPTGDPRPEDVVAYLENDLLALGPPAAEDAVKIRLRLGRTPYERHGWLGIEYSVD